MNGCLGNFQYDASARGLILVPGRVTKWWDAFAMD